MYDAAVFIIRVDRGRYRALGDASILAANRQEARIFGDDGRSRL
jgi:hypothetical protein